MKYNKIIITSIILISTSAVVIIDDYYTTITCGYKDRTCLVVEQSAVPYKVSISHLFIPPPNSSILFGVNVSYPNITLITEDFEWIYQRFKLRFVVPKSNQMYDWNRFSQIYSSAYVNYKNTFTVIIALLWLINGTSKFL